MKKYLVSLMVVALISMLACQQKGSVEKAGEKVDEVIDNVSKGDAPLKKKGVIEKTAESIEDAVDE